MEIQENSRVISGFLFDFLFLCRQARYLAIKDLKPWIISPINRRIPMIPPSRIQPIMMLIGMKYGQHATRVIPLEIDMGRRP